MTKQKHVSYRELRAELDSIVSRIELGSYDDIDALLADYEKGKGIIAELQKRLEEAETSLSAKATKKQKKA